MLSRALHRNVAAAGLAACLAMGVNSTKNTDSPLPAKSFLPALAHYESKLHCLSALSLYNFLPAGTVSFCSSSATDSGLGDSLQFFTPPDGQTKLDLVAAGMRRKNLYIVEVDVYRVGIYLSAVQDAAIRKAVAAGGDLDLVRRPVVTDKESRANMAVLLRFVRAVTTKQVVDATIEALGKGVSKEAAAEAGESYAQELQEMARLLTEGIGAAGMKIGEEMQFIFFREKGTEAVAMVIKDEYVGTLRHPLLVGRLAAVYGDCDPKTAIARGVPEQLSSRYRPSPAA